MEEFHTLQQSPGVQEFDKNYQSLLSYLTVKQIRELASRRGILLGGLKRENLIEQLARVLAQPESLFSIYKRLPDDSFRVLNLLILIEPDISQGIMGDLISHLDAALIAWKPVVRSAAQCIEELYQLGLVFQGGNEVILPLQVSTLRQITPKIFKEYTGLIDWIEEAHPTRFSRLVMQLCAAGQAGLLNVEPTVERTDYEGWPIRVGEKQSGTEKVVLEDPPYFKATSLDLLIRITGEGAAAINFAAQALDTGKFWKSHNPRQVTDRLLQWLAQPALDQNIQLFETAVETFCSTELDVARSTGGFSVWRYYYGLSKETFLIFLRQQRIRLLEFISQAPTGMWLDIGVLLKSLHGLYPYWLINYSTRAPDSNRSKVSQNLPCWIKLNNKKVDPLNYQEWLRSYGLIYETILTHTFSWLGLCDIGWKNKQAVAVRISETGACLLRRTDELPRDKSYQQAGALKLDNQNNLRLNLKKANTELLCLFLMIGKAYHPEREELNINNGLPYQMDIQGLGNAYRSGWDINHLQSTLEQNLGQQLPLDLVKTMSLVWERYDRLHLYPEMALLEFSDDYCLPELLAGTSLGQILLYTFSPRVIAVRPDGIESYMEELRSKGYTPRQEGGQSG